MKTCPECAESIQDAARKCRFCGHRLDGDVVAPTPEKAEPDVSEVPELAATKPPVAPAWACNLGALGGGLLGIGAVLFAIALIAHSRSVFTASSALLGIGGFTIGIAWCGLLMSGAGFGLVIGSFLVPATLIAAFTLGSEYGVVRPLLVAAGLFLFAMLHYFGLDDLRKRMDGVRGAAGIAMFGLGIELMAMTKKIDLPTIIDQVLAVIGVGGMVLLGLALATSLPGLRTKPAR